MGLYDDLPQAKGTPAAEASKATAAAPLVPAFLAPAVRRMAAASAAKPRPSLPSTTVPAPAPPPPPPPPVPQQHRENADSNYYAASFGAFEDDGLEEYDPQFPNDFSALAARREALALEARERAEAAARAAAAAAAAAERERQIAAAAAEAAAARERELKEEERRKEEEERGREEEEEEELPLRAGLGSSFARKLPSSSSAALPVPDSERGMPLAAKMMAKMGWEEGKGLGKKLQGAPLPLVAKKTSARQAEVVVEEERRKEKETTEAAAASSSLPSSSFSWPAEGDESSRVVLLTNVAAPGLPEEALGATEDEIGMAATASGGLRSVSVFEVVDADGGGGGSSRYPREALVRVFVEFGDAASAGRFARSVRGQPFFSADTRRGGGGVVARPFPLSRLREGRLAPEPGDVP